MSDPPTEPNTAILEPRRMHLCFDPDSPQHPDKPWMTTVDHTYEDQYVKKFTIPLGFRTDLTSYPWWIKTAITIVFPICYVYEYGFQLVSPLYHPFPYLCLLCVLFFLLVDPFGRHQRAALFHDYLYSVLKYDRRMADASYITIMKNDGVAPWRRFTYYLGVRLFGWMVR